MRETGKNDQVKGSAVNEPATSSVTDVSDVTEQAWLEAGRALKGNALRRWKTANQKWSVGQQPDRLTAAFNGLVAARASGPARTVDEERGELVQKIRAIYEDPSPWRGKAGTRVAPTPADTSARTSPVPARPLPIPSELSVSL